MRHGQGTTPYHNRRLVHRAIVRLAPGETQLEHVNIECSIIMCSVVQGGIQIFFGGGSPGTVPDLHFGQSNRPVSVPISCGAYDFLLRAIGPANPVIGSVFFFE